MLLYDMRNVYQTFSGFFSRKYLNFSSNLKSQRIFNINFYFDCKCTRSLQKQCPVSTKIQKPHCILWFKYVLPQYNLKFTI